MSNQQPSSLSDDSQEARAFLQARVALFWKVLFFLFLLGGAAGAFGAVSKPGLDLLITAALAAVAGACWRLCAHGQRSKSFSRTVEAAGLLLTLSGGALLNRYVLMGFIEQRSLVSPEGMLMADGLVL